MSGNKTLRMTDLSHACTVISTRTEDGHKSYQYFRSEAAVPELPQTQNKWGLSLSGRGVHILCTWVLPLLVPCKTSQLPQQEQVALRRTRSWRPFCTAQHPHFLFEMVSRDLSLLPQELAQIQTFLSGGWPPVSPPGMGPHSVGVSKLTSLPFCPTHLSFSLPNLFS